MSGTNTNNNQNANANGVAGKPVTKNKGKVDVIKESASKKMESETGKAAVEKSLEANELNSNPRVTSAEEEKKKDKRPSEIDLKDKSDGFKKIIDVALAYAKLEEDVKKLKNRVKSQKETIAGLREEGDSLKEERDSLKGNLEAVETLCKKKQADIEKLQGSIAYCNEVIDIVKADKEESSREFKNALAAALRSYMKDLKELKEQDMSEDIGYGVLDTLEGVFKVLEKNGIMI